MLTYTEALRTARHIVEANKEPISPKFIRLWNDFEDTLQGKISCDNADRLLKSALADKNPQNASPAMVIIAMLG